MEKVKTEQEIGFLIGQMQKPCQGCIYYAKSAGACDYIEIAGHRRPCHPGKECTVKIKGNKRKVINE